MILLERCHAAELEVRQKTEELQRIRELLRNRFGSLQRTVQSLKNAEIEQLRVCLWTSKIFAV